MNYVFAIDPGNKTGWAVFEDGRLIMCGVKSKAEMLAPPHPKITEPIWDLVVIEEPQMYQGRRAKGNPQDIIDLAVYVGQLEQRFRVTKCIKRVKPARWKGQLDKKLCHQRAREKLTMYEQNVVDHAQVDHNGWDAVAMGLWALGR